MTTTQNEVSNEVYTPSSMMDDIDPTQDIEFAHGILLQGQIPEGLDDTDGKPGEFIDAETLEVIGSSERAMGPLKFVVVGMKKFWRSWLIEEETWGEKEEFKKGQIPAKHYINNNQEKCERFLHYRFFVVKLGGDVSNEMPLVLTFKKSATPAAKAIIKHIQSLHLEKKQPYAVSIELTSVVRQKPKKHYVPAYRRGTEVSPEVFVAARQWENVLSQIDLMRAGEEKTEPEVKLREDPKEGNIDDLEF